MGQGGFSTARLRRSGRNDAGVAGAGNGDTTGARHGGAPFVISTGAVRQHGGPPLVISPGAVRSTAEWRNLVPVGQEGFSTARYALRSK